MLLSDWALIKQLETPKLTLRIVDNRYLHLTIFSDEEITADDVPAVVDFLDQFNQPVPILIERQGDYSISPFVQMAMYEGTKRRLKAAAFVDRHRRDSVLTRIARITYFQHTQVKSFYNKQDAVDWLERSFCSGIIDPNPDD